MSPYLRAHEVYHRDGEPHISWSDALDFHLQHGLVLSTDHIFLMGRFLPVWAEDHEHPDLIAFNRAQDLDEFDFHVWSASGKLDDLVRFGGAGYYGPRICSYLRLRDLTFQRRDNRLHRLDYWKLGPDRF